VSPQVTQGSLGVYAFHYVGRSGSDEVQIDDLLVLTAESEELGLYHLSTGLYGFTELEPGPTRMHAEDPRKRYLPRAFMADVPDRSADLAALLAEQAPSFPTEPGWTDVSMRPSIEFPLLPSDTTIWGQVSLADGSAAPFALVRMRNVDDDWFATYADERGVYLIRLPDETPPSPDPTVPVLRTVHAAALLATVTEDNPLSAFPANFDDIAELALADPQLHAVYDTLANPFTFAFNTVIGSRNRLDIQLTT